jgi:hypothetical protein
MNSSFSIPLTTEITPQNLSHVVDQLKDGEDIVISRRNGETRFSIKNIVGGHKVVTPLRNRTIAFLDPMPVSAGWMSHIEQPSEKSALAYKGREKEAKKVVEKKSSEKQLLKDMLETLIAFADVETAYKIQLSMQSYTVFSIMDKIVYCKEVAGEFVPAMYKENERGAFIYL